jgi:hypothetical protein
MLRRWRGAVFVAAAAWLPTGCGDGSGPGQDVLPPTLTGTWVADMGCRPHCGFTLSSVANPADTLNATQLLGLSTEIGMQRNGRFLLTFRPGTDTPLEGTARVEGALLIVTGAAGTADTMEYVVSGTTLDLRFRRIYTLFDFNGDGVPDPARARGIFVRR